MTGCFIGAGTHGKIKSYYFNCSTKDIVSKVDQFLLDNPSYYDEVLEDFGWVYITLPPENNKFGFKIGGNSEITLIAVGNENQVTTWNTELSSSEKESFTENFEKEFIQRLYSITPKSVDYSKKPFILTINKNPSNNPWPHYVIKYDTLISYPLPKEFDSLSFDYFEDLIISFAQFTDKEISVNQYYNLFRINKDISGYITDSIYVTSLYRVIGQNLNSKIIFNQKEWGDYITEEAKNTRLTDYNKLREIKIGKNYKSTDVYSDMSEEYWMVEHKEIIKTVGNNIYIK